MTNLQDQLQTNFKDLKLIQEKRAHFYETRSQNLIISYLLFQALFFIGISICSSPSSKSNYEWWVPFTIILISSVIFFVAILEAIIMVYNIQFHLDITCMELQLIHKKITEVEYGINISNIKTNDHNSIEIEGYFSNYEEIRPDVLKVLKRKVYIYLIILALLSISVIQLYACRFYNFEK